MPHYTLPRLLTNKVDVTMVGAGGNGSQMLTGLARLNKALVTLGHPGLHVTTFDPDHVSESNIGRQLFSESDIGQNKAVLLTHRVNAFFGTRWDAHPTVLQDAAFKTFDSPGDIVICCVDSRKSRRHIADNLTRTDSPDYYMDMGNRASDGQVVLGHLDATASAFVGQKAKPPADHVPLPNPYTLFPELIDTSIPEDDTPSCGLAAALEKQDLFINQSVVTPALQILWQMLRYGQLTWHGAFINLRNGSMRPMLVKVGKEGTR